MADDIKLIRRKFEAATIARSPFQEDFAEAFWYGLRQDYYLAGEGMGLSSDAQIDVLDSTAAEALEDKVHELQSILFPHSRPFIKLKRASDKDPYSDKLATAEDNFHAAIQNSNFYPEMNLAMKHAMIANGNIIIARGDNETPLRFRAVPMYQVYHSQNAMGDLVESFVESKMTWAEIQAAYGSYDLNPVGFEDLTDEQKQTEKREVVEYYHLNKDGSTNYVLFAKEANRQNEGVILELEATHAMRFISFRYDRVCGSVWGRGPMLKAMAEVRTINWVQNYRFQDMERTLGYIIAGDHSQINFDILNEPGNNKTLDVGPGVNMPQMLQKNHGVFQSDQFVAADIQGNIMRKVGNNPLPKAENGSRRTATEFQLREQQRNHNAMPDAANLYREFFKPLVEAAFHILQSDTLAGSRYAIQPPGKDDASGSPLWLYEPENYLVAASKDQLAQRIAGAVGLSLQLFPNYAQDIIDMPAVARELAMLSGVPDKFLLSEEETAERLQLRQEQEQALIDKGVQPQPQPANIEAKTL